MKQFVLLIALGAAVLFAPRAARADEYDGEYVDYMDIPEFAYSGKNTDDVTGSITTGTPPLGKVSAQNGQIVLPAQHQTYLNYEDSFGNDMWGADYEADLSEVAGSIPVTIESPAGGDYTKVTATLAVGGTIVGYHHSIVKIIGKLNTQTFPQSSDATGVACALWFCNDWTVPTGQYTREKKLFNYPIDSPEIEAINYSLWGIGLTVKFSAGGSLYTNLSGTIYTDGVRLTLTPGAEAHATGKASVDVEAGDIWAKGTVNLISVNVPIQTTAAWIQRPKDDGCEHALMAQLRGDVTVRSLNGRLRAGYTAGWGWLRGGVTLFSWDGLTRSFNIFNTDGFSFTEQRRESCQVLSPIPVPIRT